MNIELIKNESGKAGWKDVQPDCFVGGPEIPAVERLILKGESNDRSSCREKSAG
jgi:hypothetical protein